MLPCDFRTENPVRTVQPECCGGPVTIYGCAKFTECVLHPLTEKVANEIGQIHDCRTCKERVVKGKPAPPINPPKTPPQRNQSAVKDLRQSVLTTESFQLDPTNFRMGEEFETAPTFIERLDGGGCYFAYQQDDGTAIYIGTVEDMNSLASTKFSLLQAPRLPESVNGVYDPRFFYHLGRLWIQYTGESTDRKLTTFIGQVSGQGVFATHFPVNLPHTENRLRHLNFFSSGGELYCVYNYTRAMIVYSFDKDMNGKPVYVSGVDSRPTHFEVAGGANPVLRDGLWYAFFRMSFHNGMRYQTGVGVLTFENKPPFRIVKIARSPVYLPPDRQSECVESAPFGAHLDEDGRWLVSVGECGNSCKMVAVDAKAIEAALSEK